MNSIGSTESRILKVSLHDAKEESAEEVKREEQWPLSWTPKDNRICSGEGTSDGMWTEASGEDGTALWWPEG